jgi:hypothetical protein
MMNPAAWFLIAYLAGEAPTAIIAPYNTQEGCEAARAALVDWPDRGSGRRDWNAICVAGDALIIAGPEPKT